MSEAPVLVAPLAIEAFALRRGGPDLNVVRTGMGARRARRAAARLPPGPVVVAGFGGGLWDDLEPGDLVVASELVGPDGEALECPLAGALTATLRGSAVTATRAPIASVERLVRGARRRQLAGVAAAVDMESYWLATGAAGRPFGVVRAIVDTPRRELHRPLATLAGTSRAVRTLTRLGSALAGWAPTLEAGYAEATVKEVDRCRSL